MTAFRARNRSVATVPVRPEQIWEVLNDPVVLAQLTPLVDRITAKGDLWVWTLAGISGLGLEVAPTFSERMNFVPISRIEFHHEPRPGTTERAGVDGTYQITKVSDASSKLTIDLRLCVELPLPAFSGRAVEKVMAVTMARTGQAFARNLYEHLGIDPSDVRIRVIEGEPGS